MVNKELNIQKLFESEDKYIIPIYQRNYSWGEAEVTQLIIDIADYAKKNKDKNYYIGTLVVYEREIEGNHYFETIDGQQRLTTISILLSVLKHKDNTKIIFNNILQFESRKISTDTINLMYEKSIFDKNIKINTAMESAYRNLEKALKNINLDIDEFINYLLEKVVILRVNVPKDTDLNHYFEIMNNRGEQLEKHEVLKFQMLEKLSSNRHLAKLKKIKFTSSFKILTLRDFEYSRIKFCKNSNDIKIFNNIWEACSNMDRYVQYGFNAEDRKKIFTDSWDSFNIEKFDELKKEENSNTEDNDTWDIDKIIKDYTPKDNTDKKVKESSEQFNSPINFPNFLLHVLRVQTKKDISLDDKGLLNIFNEYIDKEDFVKDFGFNLLKIRYLFDKYIIKRKYIGEKDEWSLNSLAISNKQTGYYKNTFDDMKDNKKIIMLLSMFHVSYPTQIYKHWVSGCLKYLFENKKIDSNSYGNYLEVLAKNFFRRFLSINKINYYDMIILPCSLSYVIDNNLLNRGTDVENFIFNYLDYLLWKEDREKAKPEYSDFTFTFRSSVEHFYPQNPMEGHNKLDKDILDSFGNLCLISASKNSKLSNYQPIAKTEHYKNNDSKESIKQMLMMKKADIWFKKQILEHGDEMKNILGIS